MENDSKKRIQLERDALDRMIDDALASRTPFCDSDGIQKQAQRLEALFTWTDDEKSTPQPLG